MDLFKLCVMIALIILLLVLLAVEIATGGYLTRPAVVEPPVPLPTPFTVSPLTAPVVVKTPTVNRLTLTGASLPAGVLTLIGAGAPDVEIEIVDNGQVVGATKVGADGQWRFAYAPASGEHELSARVKGEPETASSPFKVMVMDDASSDGSLEMLKEKYPQVLRVANQSPKGYWFAVNQAVQMTESEYLARVPLRPGAVFGQFQELYDFLEQRPKAGLAGLLAGDNSWQDKTGRRKCSEKKIFMENCIMFRRRIINKTGIPDGGPATAGKEFKWCAGLRRAGWGVYYLLTS